MSRCHHFGAPTHYCIYAHPRDITMSSSLDALPFVLVIPGRMIIAAATSSADMCMGRDTHCCNRNRTQEFCLFCIDLLLWSEGTIDKFMNGYIAIVKALHIILVNIVRHSIVFFIAHFCPGMK